MAVIRRWWALIAARFDDSPNTRLVQAVMQWLRWNQNAYTTSVLSSGVTGGTAPGDTIQGMAP